MPILKNMVMLFFNLKKNETNNVFLKKKSPPKKKKTNGEAPKSNIFASLAKRPDLFPIMQLIVFVCVHVVLR